MTPLLNSGIQLVLGYRKKVLGAKLLALRDVDGQWAGCSYFPKGFDFATVKSEGQPWTATTWSLNSLRE